MKPREQWGPADYLADGATWGAMIVIAIILILVLLSYAQADDQPQCVCHPTWEGYPSDCDNKVCPWLEDHFSYLVLVPPRTVLCGHNSVSWLPRADGMCHAEDEPK